MMEYPKYKKILFCTDFSENSDYAFEYAYGVAKRDSGVLLILHVLPENPHHVYVESFVTKEDLQKMQKNIEEDIQNNYREHYLDKIGDSIKAQTVTKVGREDEVIIKFARDEKADLIVMGTHGRTGIEHVFFGSVAEKVIRHSPFPVFIIPCKKKLERP